MSDNGDHRPIVLYDGDCGFCKVMLAALLTWDRARRLGSAPIQSASGEQLLTTMSERERLASWHVVDVDGEVRSGGAAIPVVLAVVPGGATLARFCGAIPARNVAHIRARRETTRAARATLRRAGALVGGGSDRDAQPVVKAISRVAIHNMHYRALHKACH